MTGPIILPATHPLPAAQQIEFGAWCADKLREARALDPAGMPPPMLFIAEDAFDEEARAQLERAFTEIGAQVPPFPLSIRVLPTDPEPWEFDLIALKAGLR